MAKSNSQPQAEKRLQQPFAKKLLGWLKQLLLMLLLLTLFSAVLDIWRGRDIPKTNLPNIQATTLQGEQIDLLAMSHEQPVLLYFWGTWCPVCSFVSPSVNILADSYPVVSVAMTSGVDEKLQRYLKHKDYEFVVINDPHGEIAKQWSVQVTPTLMVIKDGELSYYTSGFTSLPGMWWRMLLA
ncbi:protein disulfide oxidoreductase [Shewanella fidelis]|uniref:Protein disulfide oxidoreductase n=1 Tax=Shewanella fidelis TaxID=173509 RepID=A0AAW8NHG0_9GAMM|nr:protein disulfide oxidoreductase [Shewanella fidelis]MDR8522764.1 protein disulfide oxidoreductase [Shewanella fidelis]MDW4812379.1 protein disulfide oxidoreductase [Shewanella fidelis]MDW4815956.1 protein disulfide oxidoreductase [Shewanella fidelis]MDW4820620.1 protein disulfide oxidoreductase [Shewanella fidelis]MDW4824842.1 protein disulfide oxidoreductase [Shewanella fidelis]